MTLTRLFFVKGRLLVDHVAPLPPVYVPGNHDVGLAKCALSPPDGGHGACVVGRQGRVNSDSFPGARWRTHHAAMALTPPNPGFQATALPIIRRLSWSPIASDVGELAGGWLALACSVEGRAVWCAGEGAAPPGLAPRHVAKDAFTAIREGDLGQDGVITWHGQRWRLADVLDGGRMVARLVGEAVAA